jgi:hypothetical protein
LAVDEEELDQLSVTNHIIQNIILTISRDNHMKAKPNQACLRIFIHSLYLPSSHAAVTIWKPHRKSITNVIKASIPSIRLINVFIETIRESFVVSADAVQATFISPIQQSAKFAQNHEQSSDAALT